MFMTGRQNTLIAAHSPEACPHTVHRRFVPNDACAAREIILVEYKVKKSIDNFQLVPAIEDMKEM